MKNLFLCVLGLFAPLALAWAPVTSIVKKNGNRQISRLQSSTDGNQVGGLHGDNSCFLPLRQLDQDYYAPRIIQIAGAYPTFSGEISHNQKNRFVPSSQHSRNSDHCGYNTWRTNRHLTHNGTINNQNTPTGDGQSGSLAMLTDSNRTSEEVDKRHAA